MEEYAQAFEKVIKHIDELDQVKVPPWKEWWGGYVPAFGKEKQESKMQAISGYR
jgi:hypothetical protein